MSLNNTDILNHVDVVAVFFRDENLVNTELASKLEAAFLSGLRCIQPQIRSRFMEVRRRQVLFGFAFSLKCLHLDH